MSVKDGITGMARELASSFDARFLGLAALMPVLEVFRRISYSLPGALSRETSPETCIACLVVGLLAALLGALASSVRCKHMQNLTPVMGGAAWSLIGMACMLPCAWSLEAPHILLVPCGYLLLGAGIGALLVGWIEALARSGALVNLLHVSLSVVLGNGLMFAVIALDTPASLWTLLTTCLLVSSLMLAWIKAGQSHRPAERATAVTTGEAHTAGMSARSCLGSGLKPDAATCAAQGNEPGGGDTPSDERGLFSIVRSSLSAPAVGLALGAFSWGVMAIPPLPYVNDHKAWVYLVGNLVALAVILILVYTLRDGARYSVMRRKMFFLLPVFAVFLSYFSFIRMLDANGGLKNFLSVGYNMSMAGFFTPLYRVGRSAEQGKGACRRRRRGARPHRLRAFLWPGRGPI